jgi:hypothetical protein
MKRDVAGDIELEASVTLPSRGFFVQAKLAEEDSNAHPYGEWSLAVECVAELLAPSAVRPVRVFLSFVAPEAPHHALKRGAQLELFRGTQYLGKILVTQGSSEDVCGLPLERNFLPSAGEDFLGAA